GNRTSLIEDRLAEAGQPLPEPAWFSSQTPDIEEDTEAAEVAEAPEDDPGKFTNFVNLENETQLPSLVGLAGERLNRID
ncbi:hypothetical protein, partial [Haemophilus parainfluenzae]|uniref:hypothetical protein n=1 Tax=Haemophilus parainfluenzae TaxID=729 RepID=UPI001788E47A